jgi:hypothetical protein
MGSFDLEAIKYTLQDAGIEFIGEVGVKMRHARKAMKTE